MPGCIGPGSLMGTSGLKWLGRDPMDDCSMLWSESLSLTNAPRAALACLLVFLLAALSQYLTTFNDCQLQQSAKLAKRRLFLALENRKRSLSFYDPALGDDCDQDSTMYKYEQSTVTTDTAEMPSTQKTNVMNYATADCTHLVLPVGRTPSLSVKVGNWTHLGDALMRGGRVLIAYMLMLVVMTYDITLITSIVAGYMTSYCIFGKNTANVPVSADPCCP